MPQQLKLYSSQTATSTFKECGRRRWFNNHIYGTGIVPIEGNVALEIGGCLHQGVELIASSWVHTGIVDLDKIIFIVKNWYSDSIDIPHTDNIEYNKEQIFQIKEQLALIEVLIRLWYLLEWPKILTHYTIFAIEQEITFPILDNENNIYQSKPDLILIHKASGDIINYSLKSTKKFDWRTEAGYKVALQHSTEVYATNLWLEQLSEQLKSMLSIAEIMYPIPYLGKNLTVLKSWLLSKSTSLRSSATRFCYMVKGEKWEETKGKGDWRTDNPFLYGYRKFTAGEIEYSVSNKISKPENKSGYGYLGKGWEKFPVWENSEVGGVKGWMEKLASGDISPMNWDGNGSVFDKYVISMPNVSLNPKVMESRIREVEAIENVIYANIENIGVTANNLEVCFPMNTQSCYYPQRCSYLPICNNGNDDYKEYIANNPLSEEWGMFKKREPHHKPEEEYFKVIS